MPEENLRGRAATDPLVHAQVLKSISEMPFRDLVASIEGEEVAAAMEQSCTADVVIAEGNTYISTDTFLLSDDKPKLPAPVFAGAGIK